MWDARNASASTWLAEPTSPSSGRRPAQDPTHDPGPLSVGFTASFRLGRDANLYHPLWRPPALQSTTCGIPTRCASYADSEHVYISVKYCGQKNGLIDICPFLSLGGLGVESEGRNAGWMAADTHTFGCGFAPPEIRSHSRTTGNALSHHPQHQHRPHIHPPPRTSSPIIPDINTALTFTRHRQRPLPSSPTSTPPHIHPSPTTPSPTTLHTDIRSHSSAIDNALSPSSLTPPRTGTPITPYPSPTTPSPHIYPPPTAPCPIPLRHPLFHQPLRSPPLLLNFSLESNLSFAF